MIEQENSYDILIIGAGPIGLACGIEAKKRGYSYVIVEKGCLVNSIYNYPANMKFFSTPDLLELGGLPFVTPNEKPFRREALEYYRRVAEAFELNIHLFESVDRVEGEDGNFTIITEQHEYKASKIIAAIGFYSRPRMLNVPGEDLPKVTHYYNEPHYYSWQKVLIVGNGNSATQTALECFRHGAEVSMAIRSSGFKEGVKYWILPDIENRVKSGEITAYFNTVVEEIKPMQVVLRGPDGISFEIANDFVIALTGYEPDYSLIQKIGIEIDDDPHRTPVHNPKTYQTTRPGVYMAGVVVGGMLTSRWFIENSRFHATVIMDHIDENRNKTDFTY